MSLIGATDQLASKPKFPQERTERVLISVPASANTIFPSNTLYFANGTAAQLSLGLLVDGVGNNAGTYGFNEVAPTITQLIGGTPNDQVMLSTNTSASIYTNTIINFLQPTQYKPNTLSASYNANTYMVSASRIANANTLLAVTHTGWNHVVVGTGGRAGRITVETLAVVSNVNTLDPNSGGVWFPGL